MSANLPGLQLCCSTICYRHFPVEAALRAIRELGFHRVDIAALGDFCPHLRFDIPDTSTENRVENLIDELELQVVGITTHIGELNRIECDHNRAVQLGKEVLRFASRTGSRGVNVNCGQFRDRAQFPLHEDINRMVAPLRTLASEAEELGIQVWIEAPHRWNLIRTLEEAIMLLKAIDHSNAFLVLDTNHIHCGGTNLSAAVSLIGADKIGIVHLRDFGGGENAYPLGTGEIDYPHLITTLDAAPWHGDLSFEFPDAGDSLAQISANINASLKFINQYRKP